VKHTVAPVLALLLLGAPAPAQKITPDQKKETVAWLTKLQTVNGGYKASPKAEQPTLGASSSALRAIKYLGGQAPDPGRTANFVQSCYHKASGGFSDTPDGMPNVRLTAVGLMALVELKKDVDPKPYEAAAVKYLGEHARNFEEIRIAVAGLEAVGKMPPQAAQWRETVEKMRNSDGTFGKGDGAARDTGGAVVALLRMGAKPEHTDAILKVLNRGQRKGGGYGQAGADADLESTYRVMRAYHMLKAKPEKADDIRAFVARCRNSDGGYGVKPGQPSTTSGTYFAAIILHWLGDV
jgi:prenyltransferase beta subunit